MLSFMHLRPSQGTTASIVSKIGGGFVHTSVLDDHVAQDSIPRPLKVNQAWATSATDKLGKACCTPYGVPSQSIGGKNYIYRKSV